MQDLAKSCTCEGCRKKSFFSRSIDFWYPKREKNSKDFRNPECRNGKFLSFISFWTAAILAISLFESPATVLVSLDFHSVDPRFEQAINDIITSGQPAFCRHYEILAHALVLIGHKKPDPDTWVISCYKGQAVYPRVFETGNICHPGFLALYWAPGSLLFDGEVYDKGIEPRDMILQRKSVLMRDPPGTNPPRTVTKPLNLYRSMRMEWKVVRRDGYLEIYPTCGPIYGLASFILRGLAGALIVSCSHDRGSPLQRPDSNSHFIDPFYWDPFKLEILDQIGIIGADGNTDIRMFAMSRSSNIDEFQAGIVIRDNACLQCCLDLCRETGYMYVLC